VGNVFGMCHAPFTLKISFVYFENKTRRNVVASNTSQSFFHWQSNVVVPDVSHLISIKFSDTAEIVLTLNMYEIFSAGR